MAFLVNYFGATAARRRRKKDWSVSRTSLKERIEKAHPGSCRMDKGDLVFRGTEIEASELSRDTGVTLSPR